MPRAMVEIAHQLPNAILIPYPVLSAKIKNESWWSNEEIIKVLASEYIKYLFARVRLRLDLDPAG